MKTATGDRSHAQGHVCYAEFDESEDEDASEPDEPDSERPDPDRDFDQERREAVGEATSTAMDTEASTEA